VPCRPSCAGGPFARQWSKLLRWRGCPGIRLERRAARRLSARSYRLSADGSRRTDPPEQHCGDRGARLCASDIVIAGKSAKFLAGATRVGMAPDGGASVILPRLVGFRRAADIVLSNRIVTTDEALTIGLITRSAADEDLAGEARKMVLSYAENAPRAVAAAKRLLWTGLGTSVESCLPEEARTVAELSATADAREGLAAVLEKRAPVFTGG
jgi:1,4-dihydroxy-2-naphthoyl-CoA synthase